MIEKVMYKVKRNDDKKVYRVQDFTSGDNIEESKFVEGTNSKGAPQLQAQVCVLYQDEYNDLISKIDSYKQANEDLQTRIKRKQQQIDALEQQVKESKRANVGEVHQLKEEKFNITQAHDKEVNKLNQDISNLEKSHFLELEDLKETHANQLHAIGETHKKEIEKLNEQYNSKLDELNDKLLTEVKGNKQASNDLREQMLAITQEHKKEIDTLHQDLQLLESEHANEILELTKAHQDEVAHLKEEQSLLKQDHLKEINEKDNAHSEDIEKVRHTFLGLINSEHAQDVSDISEIKKDVPSLLKPFMRKAMKKIDEFEERKHTNTPESIVKTYELAMKKEK